MFHLHFNGLQLMDREAWPFLYKNISFLYRNDITFYGCHGKKMMAFHHRKVRNNGPENTQHR